MIKNTSRETKLEIRVSKVNPVSAKLALLGSPGLGALVSVQTPSTFI